jgi:ubiquinone biosynthesis protein COQ9
MALGLKPQNLPTTLSKLGAISDEIWYLSGDQSTDINWYTKRALLT